MTHMLKNKQSNLKASQRAPPKALGMFKGSSVIPKPPKVRVIHISDPEIIKIDDVAHFPELVQRLTGKPSPENNTSKGKMVKRQASLCNPTSVRTKLDEDVMMVRPLGSLSSSSSLISSSSCDYHQELHDQEDWKSSSSSSVEDYDHSCGGFLSAFRNLDDNFQFSSVFHMEEDHGSSNYLNPFGETTY